MILGILLLIAGLTISAVAIYYSVLGLAAIFAAATLPIYIMGGALEVSKLIAASWLKANWNRAVGFIKWYMFSAVAILMCITSLGIFGFLSKAHLDQGLVSGSNQVQLQELDRQIEIEKRSISDSILVIAQLDQAVQSLTNNQNIRGRDGALSVRRSQAAERTALNEVIKTANANISDLEKQKMPLLQEKLAIEAEVGPIKYIAQFIYGANPNKDILEKAVTLVIILLVIVFDPLAVAMLLAAQLTFKWCRDDKEKLNASNRADNDISKNATIDTNREPRGVESILEEPDSNNRKSNSDHEVLDRPASNTAIQGINLESTETTLTEEFNLNKHPYLFKGGFGFKESAPMVQPPESIKDPIVEDISEDIVELISEPITEDIVEIIEEDMTIFAKNDTAYQILPELIEESSKKKFMIKNQGQQILRTTK